jgi:hypothetical protein
MVQLGFAISAFRYGYELPQVGQKGFERLFEALATQPNDHETLKAIDGIQRGLQCCGRTGPSDWAYRSISLPTSCCLKDVTTCTVQTAFDIGCEEVLGNFVSVRGLWIAWIAIMFAIFEV